MVGLGFAFTRGDSKPGKADPNQKEDLRPSKVAPARQAALDALLASANCKSQPLICGPCRKVGRGRVVRRASDSRNFGAVFFEHSPPAQRCVRRFTMACCSSRDHPGEAAEQREPLQKLRLHRTRIRGKRGRSTTGWLQWSPNLSGYDFQVITH